MCHRLVQQACSGTDPALPVQLPHTRILLQLKKGKPLRCLPEAAACVAHAAAAPCCLSRLEAPTAAACAAELLSLLPHVHTALVLLLCHAALVGCSAQGRCLCCKMVCMLQTH